MRTESTHFDVSEYLDDEQSIAEYLTAVMEEHDTQLLLAAIGDIAKARGMSTIASQAGLGRESLYKALNENAKPRFDTILKVLEALGVNITFSPRHSDFTSASSERWPEKSPGRAEESRPSRKRITNRPPQ